MSPRLPSASVSSANVRASCAASSTAIGARQVPTRGVLTDVGTGAAVHAFDDPRLDAQGAHFLGGEITHELARAQERGKAHEAPVPLRAAEVLEGGGADAVAGAQQPGLAARAGFARTERGARRRDGVAHGLEQLHHRTRRQGQVFAFVEPHAVAGGAQVDADRPAVVAMQRHGGHGASAARTRHARDASRPSAVRCVTMRR